jgi:hypothetical protein
MKRIVSLAIFAAALSSLGFTTEVAFAAKADSAYAQKKAECQRDAKARNFGVHFIKRNRWVKNCIAGHRT